MTFSSLALVASVGLLAVLAFDLRLEKSFLSHKSRKEVIDIPNPCERFSSSEHWIVSVLFVILFQKLIYYFYMKRFVKKVWRLQINSFSVIKVRTKLTQLL